MKNLFSLALAAFLSILANPVGAAPAPTAPSPAPQKATAKGRVVGRILFLSGKDGIVTMNSDGTDRKKLTDDSLNLSSFSADGTKIVYQVYDPEDYKNDIFVMDADGTHRTRVTWRADSDDPHFSPDGKQIAFTSYDVKRDPETNGQLDHVKICIINADGTDLTPLKSDLQFAKNPRYSPDGTRIVFEGATSEDSAEGYVNQLWSMNADGTQATRLSRGPSDANANFSPDGKKIVFEFSKMDGSRTDIWMMNADGTGRINLTRDTPAHAYLGDSYRPSFSPDGKHILFETTPRVISPTVPHLICMINLDGSEWTHLADGYAPLWVPATPHAKR